MSSRSTRQKKEVFRPEQILFALDIGTRSVVAVAGVPEGEKLRILALEMQEHSGRAMLDGQIHDIDQVSRVIRSVRERVEEKLGCAMPPAAIAAAGRVLKTCQVSVRRDLDPEEEIPGDVIRSLEIEGVQMAREQLEDSRDPEDPNRYYCVGYTVTGYRLNGYPIGNLEGHKGVSAGADVLATFLPEEVVESLYTAVRRAGLEVSCLTLEPIAAIGVTVPPDLRLLNLALIDIGAGTSDIALTRSGSIVAYGMVPVAGDELTEAVAGEYLTDFATAEAMKRALSDGRKSISYRDVLLVDREIPAAELKEFLAPQVDSLAELLTGRILELNQKAPNAVFLIGGGSQIPGLTDALADRLGLRRDRVVIRDRKTLGDSVAGRMQKLGGPDMVTPLGIAVHGMKSAGRDFVEVFFNGDPLRLFQGGSLTMADVLIAAGFPSERLIGRSGRPLRYFLNGEEKTLRGGSGEPAVLELNGKPVALEALVSPGDRIVVTGAREGEERVLTAGDLISGSGPAEVIFNEAVLDVSPRILINGSPVPRDRRIRQGDRVETVEILTLGDLFRYFEIETTGYQVLIGELPAGEETTLKQSDVIRLLKEQPPAPAVRKEPAGTVVLQVNGEPVELPDRPEGHIFVDLFENIDFDLKRPRGTISLELNGRQASYTDPLKAGDRVRIFWSEDSTE